MESKVVFDSIEKMLQAAGLNVVNKDLNRPWGGFYVIDEHQTAIFARKFFADQVVDTSGKLSPKILVVAPGKRLSWQYHFRRSEIWKLIDGAAGIVRSHTDEQGAVQHLELNKTITLPKGERHRLVGTSEWGIVAEIWQHTDPQHPSDESDIVRLQDDFGR